MRTDCNQDSFDFGTVEGQRVVGAFDGGQITSHAAACSPAERYFLRALDLGSRMCARAR
jgi:hypothetical protein